MITLFYICDFISGKGNVDRPENFVALSPDPVSALRSYFQHHAKDGSPHFKKQVKKRLVEVPYGKLPDKQDYIVLSEHGQKFAFYTTEYPLPS